MMPFEILSNIILFEFAHPRPTILEQDFVVNGVCIRLVTCLFAQLTPQDFVNPVEVFHRHKVCLTTSATGKKFVQLVVYVILLFNGFVPIQKPLHKKVLQVIRNKEVVSSSDAALGVSDLRPEQRVG